MVLTFLPKRSASSLLVQARPPETTVSAAMARRSCSWVFVKRRFLGPRRAPAPPAAPSARPRAGPRPSRPAPGSLGEHPPPAHYSLGLRGRGARLPVEAVHALPLVPSAGRPRSRGAAGRRSASFGRVYPFGRAAGIGGYIISRGLRSRLRRQMVPCRAHALPYFPRAVRVRRSATAQTETQPESEHATHALGPGPRKPLEPRVALSYAVVSTSRLDSSSPMVAHVARRVASGSLISSL